MDKRRAKRWIGAVSQIPGVTRKAMKMHNGGLFGVLGKIFQAFRRRWLPEEALIDGLLDPSLPDAEFDKRISRSILVKHQERRNPAAWDALLADKTIFYRFCLAAGIPVPALFAIFSRRTPGWACSGKLLSGREQWISFLESECPPYFVIKPDRGTHGEDIWFLERQGDRFIDPDGQWMGAGEIYAKLMSSRQYEMFAIQERLRNHEEIVRFTGSDALHTMRMITMLQPTGESVLVYAHFKLILGNHYFDNYGSGESGNVMIDVDRAAGVLTNMLLVLDKPLLVHPKTGRQIAGFPIPHWKEVCATINNAARKFSPVGTIGWDLAVTPRGPVIIEGNIWYDAPSVPDIRTFISRLYPPGICMIPGE